MGFGGREFARRAVANAMFIQALSMASGGRVIPVAGGVLIREAAGEIAGAVGISRDTSENDESCAVYGTGRAGLVADTGDPPKVVRGPARHHDAGRASTAAGLSYCDLKSPGRA